MWNYGKQNQINLQKEIEGGGGGGGGEGGEKLNLLKMEKNSCTKVQEDLKQTM